MRWLGSITNSMDMKLSKLRETVRDREVVGAAGMCPVRDKFMRRERNLQGSSSSHGAAPGAQYVPSGAAGMRKEPARQLSPSRLSRGPVCPFLPTVLLLLGFLLIFGNDNI